MRRNKNIHKGRLILTSDFMDWFRREAAVGGEIVSISEDSFEFQIDDEIVTVNNDESKLQGMAVTIDDQEIFSKILSSIEVGQSLRTGSGQWTFYAEPDEIRYIISEAIVNGNTIT